MLGEEGIRPAAMIVACQTEPRTLIPLTQDGPQPPADKAVDCTEGRVVCVLEVAKPPFQERIQLGYDIAERAASSPTGELANLVPDCLKTLASYKAAPAFEAVTQEVKTMTCILAVPYMRLVWMQHKSMLRRPGANLSQCGLGFFLALAA